MESVVGIQTVYSSTHLYIEYRHIIVEVLKHIAKGPCRLLSNRNRVNSLYY